MLESVSTHTIIDPLGKLELPESSPTGAGYHLPLY